MKRRAFLAAGLAGGGAVAAPALAQSAPEIRWRLAAPFPPSADIVMSGAEQFCRQVAEATDGRFQIRIVPGAEVAPPDGLLDAIGAGTAEMAYAPPYLAFAKDPVFGLLTSVPFGLNTRGTQAWFSEAGGLALANAFLAKHGLVGLLGGNSGAQMGGWFRREVKSPADLRGLKVRTTGLAGPVLSRLGVQTLTTPPGDIYSGLESGALDAADWIGPYDDEKLGLWKVAPFYYYPGWFEPSATLAFLFNARRWAELPKPYRAIAEAAAAHANGAVLARYDARNPAALRRVVGSGAKLVAFPQDVLEACFKASGETCDALSAASADFKAIWDSMRAFRSEEYLWFQVNEYTYDNFMIRARARG